MKIRNLAVLPIIALTVVTPSAHAKERQSPLIGSWVVTISPPADVTPYIEITSVAFGGTATGSPPAKPPPGLIRTGDAYGVWAQSSEDSNAYDLTAVAFTYDGSGAINGTVKFVNHATLINNDEFEGISQFQVCDLNLVCPEPTPGGAKITGTRLQIQPVTQ
jgi:hypothetical protein